MSTSKIEKLEKQITALSEELEVLRREEYVLKPARARAERMNNAERALRDERKGDRGDPESEV